MFYSFLMLSRAPFNIWKFTNIPSTRQARAIRRPSRRILLKKKKSILPRFSAFFPRIYKQKLNLPSNTLFFPCSTKTITQTFQVHSIEDVDYGFNENEGMQVRPPPEQRRKLSFLPPCRNSLNMSLEYVKLSQLLLVPPLQKKLTSTARKATKVIGVIKERRWALKFLWHLSSVQVTVFLKFNCVVVRPCAYWFAGFTR